MSKTPCATFLLLAFGVQTLCATVVLLQIGPFCKEAKACEKRRAQLSCCSKFAPSQTAQLSFCSKLGRIVRKLKPVGDCVRNCPVNSNWCLFLKKNKRCANHLAQLSCCSKFASKHSAQLSFCFKLARILRKPKRVKNAVHNFPVARNWPQITLRNSRFA